MELIFPLYQVKRERGAEKAEAAEERRKKFYGKSQSMLTEEECEK